MEDPLVQEMRREVRGVHTELIAIRILLAGNPADESGGMIRRVEELEKWKAKIEARVRRLMLWVTAVITSGGAIFGVIKILQSITK